MTDGLKVEKEHEDTLKWLAHKIDPKAKLHPSLLLQAKKHIVGDHTEERQDYYDGLELVEKLPSSEIKSLRKQHKLT